MATPRAEQISLDDTLYYHCISRCVRRAYLCGEQDGKNCNHRRAWLLDRLREIASVFTIRVCAYAILSNHYHLVLYVDQAQASQLTDDDVARRWKSLFRLAPDPTPERVAKWRERLADISWFMRALNEYIARRANKEDNCKGHFWEGRFRSQALLDEGALFACMAYVDLNPVRAHEVQSPEESPFTSFYERIQQVNHEMTENTEEIDTETVESEMEPTLLKTPSHTSLMEFRETSHVNNKLEEKPCLSMALNEYISLVDHTGRKFVGDHKAAIPVHLQQILTRVGISSPHWETTVCEFGRSFAQAAGHRDHLEQRCRQRGKRWVKGIRKAKLSFRSVA